MRTTAVHLGAEDEGTLDKLASDFGGRSATIRHAIRPLAADIALRDALTEFLNDWNKEARPLDKETVEAMATRYGL